MNVQKNKSNIEASASSTIMNGLEVITVRIAEKDGFKKALEYCTQFFHTLKAVEKNNLSSFRSAGYESDISVYIRCHLGPSKMEKSLLGLQLAAGLGKFGIISHTLWIDLDII